MFNYSSRQKDGEADKPNEEHEEAGAREDWRNGINLQEGHSLTVVDGETGESIPEQVIATVSLISMMIMIINFLNCIQSGCSTYISASVVAFYTWELAMFKVLFSVKPCVSYYTSINNDYNGMWGLLSCSKSTDIK